MKTEIDWQPISNLTSPSDGARLLLYVPPSARVWGILIGWYSNYIGYVAGIPGHPDFQVPINPTHYAELPDEPR